MTTHHKKRQRLISSRFMLVLAVVLASFLAAFLGQVFITQLSLSPSLIPEPGIIVRSSQEQLVALRQAAQKVSENQKPAFVRLYQRGAAAQPISGWVVSSDGWIVYVAEPNIDDATVASVRLENGDVLDVQKRLFDPATDLRFVKIERDRLQPVSIAQEFVGQPFEPLMTVSQEMLFAPATFSGVGLASATHMHADRVERLPRVVVASGAGQAVYNTKGEIAGLVTRPEERSNAVVPMIPAEELRKVLNMVLRSSAIERVSLGISYVDLAHTTLLLPDAMPSTGAWLSSASSGIDVLPGGSAAAKAGLRLNDIITAVDGVPVSDRHGISDVIAQAKPGSSIELTVLRRDTPLTISVPLAAVASR